MEDRREWEHVTEPSRHLAVAADAELRRRHPGQTIEPLRSAGPPAVSDTEREQLHPSADGKIAEMAAWIRDLTAQRQQRSARRWEELQGAHGPQ